MKGKTMRHWVCRNAFAVGLTVGASVMLTSCEDDTLTGQPSWLGNSIYERLQEEGNYKTTLRLIDELGQTEVLSQTGSRTLFVADDAAYERWFASDNVFGVKSYEQLSLAQKKLLLNSAMVKNAYLVELLSNVQGVESMRGGRCMRRPSAVTIYDSVSIMKPEDMPGFSQKIAPDDSPGPKAWQPHYGKSEGMVIMKDATPAPMIHFLPAFMNYKNITGEDLSILTNGVSNTTGDAWVNGRKIIERDITCKNGYIHKVDGVIEPLSNMSEIIHQNDEMSTWAMLMDRFSAPYYSADLSNEYNRLYNGGANKDSVFTLKYFSDWAQAGYWNISGSNFSSGTYTNVPFTPTGEAVADRLAFDPGWNQYMYSNTSGNTFYYDAGMMLVPTNEALAEWFSENGNGSELLAQFGSWDNVPDQTLKELLNANMVESFSDHVPSMFNTILDKSTQLELGVDKNSVVSSHMGCNGVVYLVNKVYTPKSYASVAFPAMIREDILKVIYWALDNCDYLPYVNSMESKYSLILPANTAMLQYVDPLKYGGASQSLLEFSYDETEKKVVASRYNCTVEADGTVTKGVRVEQNVNETIVKNRLTDILEHLIIVGEIEKGDYEYYKTKGGSYVRVLRDNGLAFQGAWQIENNSSLPVVESYPKENGVSYQVDNQMPLSSTRSVYMLLRQHDSKEDGDVDDAYSEFYKMMDAADGAESMFASQIGNTTMYYCANQTANKNVRLFENYNYTLYVPTNEAIKELTKADVDGNSGEGAVLPTWEDYTVYQNYLEDNDAPTEGADPTLVRRYKEAELAVELIEKRITDFVRYHIQDNSLIIGEEPKGLVSYETMLVNPANGRFYSLDVNLTSDNITVTDQRDHTYNVVKTEGLYNNICREYWFKPNSSIAVGDNGKTIYMSSDVVVHQIDGVLMAEDWRPWKEVLAEEVEKAVTVQ